MKRILCAVLLVNAICPVAVSLLPVIATADVSVPTNTTAQRFSTLTVEEKLSYLDGVMDSISITHAASGGAWICPKQRMAVYLLLTEKAITTYSANEGPSALLKPAAFYALLAQQALGCAKR